MNLNLENSNVATALIVIFAIVGAAVVILSAVDVVNDPQLRLAFKDYLAIMGVSGGLLAVGRGYAARKR